MSSLSTPVTAGAFGETLSARSCVAGFDHGDASPILGAHRIIEA
jgi:hypothetical protein